MSAASTAGGGRKIASKVVWVEDDPERPSLYTDSSRSDHGPQARPGRLGTLKTKLINCTFGNAII